MKDRKLYCLSISKSTLYPNFHICSANNIIKTLGFDKEYVKQKLRTDTIIKIDVDKSDCFFFSYNVEYLKQKAYAERKIRIDKLKSKIKVLEKIDIENLPGISKEQEGE